MQKTQMAQTFYTCSTVTVNYFRYSILSIKSVTSQKYIMCRRKYKMTREALYLIFTQFQYCGLFQFILLVIFSGKISSTFTNRSNTFTTRSNSSPNALKNLPNDFEHFHKRIQTLCISKTFNKVFRKSSKCILKQF